MSEIEAPVRTAQLPRCRCITYYSPPPELLENLPEEQQKRYPQASPCAQRVSNPDNPVCDDCQATHWNADGTSDTYQLAPLESVGRRASE